jgi:CO dehydrogenase/acetyl-CoA synthase epsilon subunit
MIYLSFHLQFIFRRDLKSCPVFSNLKTLSLNEYWCVPADFSALAYMLEHSPILEKLTLKLFSKV